MKLIKIPISQLKSMNQKGFIEITPYIHNNPLVRWIFWKRLKTVLSLTKPAKTVLDFGSGSGIFLPSLAKNFDEVYSIDLNTESLNYIKKLYGLENVRILKSQGETLPFKDDFFDIVFATDVLEHFKDSTFIQKEFRRVLKKDGYLIVSGPTENSLYRLARKFMYKRKKPLDHYTDVGDVIKKTLKFFKISKLKILPFRFIPGFKVYKAVKY